MTDDFSEGVKRVLANRVGNRCSNPACRALTSGPQKDPMKSLNVGVAAHITAASPGGPRFDPHLSPDQRCSPDNGIWLCQTCAKLIDNDQSRFTVEMLEEWKRAAEKEALDTIGRTAAPLPVAQIAQGTDLSRYARVRIEPIVPRYVERDEWIVEESTAQQFNFRKANSGASISIPKTFIATIHPFEAPDVSLVELRGRLQWLSLKRYWRLFRETAVDDLGVGKDVDFQYPTRLNVANILPCRWFREDNVAHGLGSGWFVFYDEDGKFLRTGRGETLILLTQGL